jgi:hypothetical protein
MKRATHFIGTVSDPMRVHLDPIYQPRKKPYFRLDGTVLFSLGFLAGIIVMMLVEYLAGT